MARRSKTEFAILGLLSLNPMSGFDMKTFISTSIGFFWQESYGQIYPTLKRLLSNGLVSLTVQESETGPPRHVYSITTSGQAALTDWMKTGTEPELVRHEMLLKLFFGPAVEPEVHIWQIEALLEHQRKRLEQFENVERTTMEEWKDTPYHPYFHATLRFGFHLTRARVAWCEETIERLRAIGGEMDQPPTN